MLKIALFEIGDLVYKETLPFEVDDNMKVWGALSCRDTFQAFNAWKKFIQCHKMSCIMLWSQWHPSIYCWYKCSGVCFILILQAKILWCHRHQRISACRIGMKLHYQQWRERLWLFVFICKEFMVLLSLYDPHHESSYEHFTEFPEWKISVWDCVGKIVIADLGSASLTHWRLLWTGPKFYMKSIFL